MTGAFYRPNAPSFTNSFNALKEALFIKKFISKDSDIL